jgi:hypothetical protein
VWDVAYPETIDFGGVTECDVPCDESTEVVTNDVGGFTVFAVDQFAHVSDEFRLSIGIDTVRSLAQITAPLVRNNHTEASVGKRADLVAPAVPEIRMAVQEYDEWSIGVSRRDNVKPDVVDVAIGGFYSVVGE